MCDITTIDRGDRGKVTVEFQRRPDRRAHEVLVMNESPDGVEMGVSIICQDNGKITNIEQLPLRTEDLPVAMVNVSEIREIWETVKEMSFFKNSAGGCRESCKRPDTTREVAKMDQILKED